MRIGEDARQVVGVALREDVVIGAPNDAHGHLATFQRGFYAGERIGFEREVVGLELFAAQRRTHERRDVVVDGFVGECRGIAEYGRTESRARERFVRHPFGYRVGKRTGACLLDHRLDLGRWAVGLDVAVGQQQRTHAGGMARREQLRDRAAAVAGDEVDVGDAEFVQQRGDHRGLVAGTERLLRRHFRIAEPHQVGRDAAPVCAEAVDRAAPLIAIER